MAYVKVSARGQVTFRQEILRHLGVAPGERIALDLLPDGRVTLQAERAKGSVDGFIGVLSDKAGKTAPSLETLSAAAADGWAGKA